MLRVDNLVLIRGTQKPLSFQALEGEVIGVQGENGSGKSTLLLTLLGELPSKSGEIRIDNQVLSSIPPRDLGSIFGYAPQTPDFQGDIQVRRVLELLNIDQNNPLLERLGITELFESSVIKLSGGETQRLQIAISIVGGSRIVLLDEPLASQDSVFKHLIEEVIKEFSEQGQIFIIASHIAFSSTRIITLD